MTENSVLKEVLKLAISTGQCNNTCGEQTLPIDSERRQYLDRVICSLTCDVSDTLKTCLSLLRDRSENEEAQLQALHTIREYSDNIDFAHDLQQLGAIDVLVGLITAEEAACLTSKVHSEAAAALTDMLQNNTQCQRAVLCTHCPQFITRLLALVVGHKSEACLSTLSALLRDCADAQRIFCEADGPKALGSLLVSDVSQRMRHRAAFLLASVHDSALWWQNLIDTGTLTTLAGVLAADCRAEWHEHVLRALVTSLDESCLGAAVTARAAVCLRATSLETSLRSHVKQLCPDQHAESLQYCNLLLEKLFSHS